MAHKLKKYYSRCCLGDVEMNRGGEVCCTMCGTALLLNEIEEVETTTDEDVLDNKKTSESCKYDSDKLRYDLIDPIMIEELAKVLTYGANKYSPNGWQNLDNFEDRYYGALLRHIQAWRSGECIDKESGLSHLSHALTNIAFLIYKQSKDEK